MTVDSEKLLFGDKFDLSIDTFHQIFRTSRTDDFRELARRLGEAVVTRVYDWSLENTSDDFSVDLRWKMASGIYKCELIEKDRMQRVVAILGQVADERTKTIDAFGTLVGIDLDTKRFHFVAGKSRDFRGVLSEDFPAFETIEVGRMYRARISTTTTVVYATGAEDVVHRLRHLQSDPSA